ncbi:unnamed protein product, partial [Prorocentrum cordatum]
MLTLRAVPGLLRSWGVACIDEQALVQSFMDAVRVCRRRSALEALRGGLRGTAGGAVALLSQRGLRDASRALAEAEAAAEPPGPRPWQQLHEKLHASAAALRKLDQARLATGTPAGAVPTRGLLGAARAEAAEAEEELRGALGEVVASEQAWRRASLRDAGAVHGGDFAHAAAPRSEVQRQLRRAVVAAMAAEGRDAWRRAVSGELELCQGSPLVLYAARELQEAWSLAWEGEGSAALWRAALGAHRKPDPARAVSLHDYFEEYGRVPPPALPQPRGRAWCGSCWARPAPPRRSCCCAGGSERDACHREAAHCGRVPRTRR